jgi:hypothetical protein
MFCARGHIHLKQKLYQALYLGAVKSVVVSAGDVIPRALSGAVDIAHDIALFAPSCILQRQIERL